MGGQTASVGNRVDVPGYVFVNLGARYQLDLDHHSAVLCIEIANVTNAYGFGVQSDGGISPLWPRRAWAYLVVDL